MNPLEGAEKCGNSRVKKSVSGEVGRNVSDASPSVESLKDVRPFNEGGTVPKHRKIRIQQVSNFPAARPSVSFRSSTFARVSVILLSVFVSMDKDVLG